MLLSAALRLKCSSFKERFSAMAASDDMLTGRIVLRLQIHAVGVAPPDARAS